MKTNPNDTVASGFHSQIPEKKRGAQDDIVCIVEDDALVRKTLKKLFELHRLKVVDYADGFELLDDPAIETYACLVMDVLMPRLSGIELHKRLLARGCRVPVIFVTGHGDVPMAVQAMSDGAFYFLQKPVNHHLLLEKVQLATELHRSRRAILLRRAGLEKRMQSLTQREHEVLEILLKGKTSKTIADELAISVRTVDDYRAGILKKMGCATVAELMAMLSESHGQQD